MLRAAAAWLAVALVATASASAADSGCSEALRNWLNTLAPRNRISDDSSLLIDWAELSRELELHGQDNCSQKYTNLHVELWTISPDSINPAFPLRSCKNLDPNTFKLHSNIGHDMSRVPVGQGQPEQDRFKHIQDKELLFRVCPCGRWKALGKCDCHYPDHEPLCSTLITNENATGANALCTKGNSEDFSKSNYFDSPIIVNCSHQIHGIVPTCTPVQSYDQITIALHKEEEEEDLEDCHNRAIFPEKMYRFTLPLFRVNETHGRFNFTFGSGQVAKGTYCVRVQTFLHNPYCNRTDPDITRRYGLERSHFPVCEILIPVPQVVKDPEDCQSPRSPDSVSPISYGRWVLYIGVPLVALIAVVAVLYYRLRKCKKTSAIFKSIRKPEREFFPTSVLTGPVFLLHVPCTDSFNEAMLELRVWLQDNYSDSKQIYDLSDDTRSELIACHQDDWVTKLLEHSETRVIIVNSPSAVALLRDDQFEEEASQQYSENSPLHNAGLESSAADDNVRDLRRFALREVINRLSGNYKRVQLVNLGPGLKPMLKDLDSILPMWQQLQIPEQLPELRSWLRGSGSGGSQLTSSASAKALRSAIESCRTAQRTDESIA